MLVFVSHQLCWKDHLDFHCHAVCMDECRSCSSTKKVKFRFSKENARTDFCKTWYVGSGGQKYYPRGMSSPNVHT